MKERNVSYPGHFYRAAAVLFATALSSFAFDLRHISEIQQTAQELERNATLLQNALKSKNPNVETAIANFQLMTSKLSSLDLIAHRFEASKPTLDESTKATWTNLRQKIQALSLSHDSKDRLVGQDLPKYRFMIRAYADGVAQKARTIQSSAAKIQNASDF